MLHLIAVLLSNQRDSITTKKNSAIWTNQNRFGFLICIKLDQSGTWAETFIKGSLTFVSLEHTISSQPTPAPALQTSFPRFANCLPEVSSFLPFRLGTPVQAEDFHLHWIGGSKLLLTLVYCYPMMCW